MAQQHYDPGTADLRWLTVAISTFLEWFRAPTSIPHLRRTTRALSRRTRSRSQYYNPTRERWLFWYKCWKVPALLKLPFAFHHCQCGTHLALYVAVKGLLASPTLGQSFFPEKKKTTPLKCLPTDKQQKREMLLGLHPFAASQRHRRTAKMMLWLGRTLALISVHSLEQ